MIYGNRKGNVRIQKNHVLLPPVTQANYFHNLKQNKKQTNPTKPCMKNVFSEKENVSQETSGWGLVGLENVAR